jgi:TonB-dependent SusC/RagA subfamily outer membrane receptor
MKTKFNGILTLLLALTVQFTFAQKTVSGTVSDDGGPLPGVSVIIKGTKTGTETDFDGKYSLQAKQGDVLQFSYVGKQTAERTVGTSNTIDVKLTDDANVLEEVVITALGIPKEKKSLGYATQSVKGDDMANSPVMNFADALSGEVAGLNVQSYGNMGGSANMIVRGYKSIYGSNQALVIIDGTPVLNDITNSGNVATGRGGYDYGNAAMDINPDDIESVNVLKGAAASALYGSRANNGVIMITTKKVK